LTIASTFRVYDVGDDDFELRLARGASGPGLALQSNAGIRNHGCQLARLEHLARDVAPPHELAFYVKLRDRRPIGIFLDPLPNVCVLEHVDADNRRAEIIQNLDDLAGEPALRKFRRSFNE
jgi:hypothetical protein